MLDRTISFSIIVPTFNRAGHIVKTIHSVLQQEYANFELIIVDDGSTDGTDRIVLSFSDDRIKYFYKSNEERAVARNYGVARACGKYVTFLDSDDLLLPHHLVAAASFVNDHGDVNVFHLGYDVVSSDGKVIYPWKSLPDPVNKKLAEGNFLSCLGVFIKQEILLKYPFNEDRGLSGSEDYELWIRLAAHYPIRTRSIVTAQLVNHDNRSVLQLNVEAFVTRIDLTKKYLLLDKNVQTYFGIRLKSIFAHHDLYASLHLAMANKQRMGWKYLMAAIGQWPTIVFNYRFIVVVKKLIFK
ncbi:MAG TPA: glycosyltransferase [Cyclobacteriaceae bacterium]